MDHDCNPNNLILNSNVRASIYTRLNIKPSKRYLDEFELILEQVLRIPNGLAGNQFRLMGYYSLDLLKRYPVKH